jgi:hypothetical protein
MTVTRCVTLSLLIYLEITTSAGSFAFGTEIRVFRLHDEANVEGYQF